MKGYRLIDSGGREKLEEFGDYRVIRPSLQAVWEKREPAALWKEVDGVFRREGGWEKKERLPKEWWVPFGDLTLKVSPTGFGHLGVFPEHVEQWPWLYEQIEKVQNGNKDSSTPPKILNLFAYSGATTLALAKRGAHLCHVDASKGMIAWGKESGAKNGLDGAPIRWIAEDAVRFLRREERRGVRYDGIILDPPSFGRGNKGEIFKIEWDIGELLSLIVTLLGEEGAFVLFSCHTPGWTPLVMESLLSQPLKGRGGNVSAGEMVIPCEGGGLPSGSYARWSRYE